MTESFGTDITFHPARQRPRRRRTVLYALAAFAAGALVAPVAVHVGIAMMLADGIARAFFFA